MSSAHSLGTSFGMGYPKPVSLTSVNRNLLTSAFSQMGSQLGQLSTLMGLKKTKAICTLDREGKSDLERVKIESSIKSLKLKTGICRTS